MAADGFPIRFGRDFTTATPGNNDLWLAQYGGEVLAAFDENLVAKDFIRTLTIAGGRSLEFPMLHKMAAQRHTPGSYITGQDVATGKRVITVDDEPVLVPFELSDVDNAKAHFDVRQEMSKQAGMALAREVDKNIFQLVVNASRTTADAGGSPFNGGGYNADPDAALTGADWQSGAGTSYATDTALSLPDTATSRWGKNHALTLLKALEEITISWDDRDIPQEDRKVALMPAGWHALRQLGLPVDKATTSTIVGYNPFRGQGERAPADADPSRGQVLEFSGFKIFRSPNIPRTNITTGEAKYRGDFSKVRAIASQRQSTGLLILMGVANETTRDVRTQTDLFVTKMLYGGGALRPECAVTIAIP